eukprot:jgi/Hompol1/7027/HPOL_000292-RA
MTFLSSLFSKPEPTPGMSINKTEDEWRAVLSKEQFRILRQKGTEAPGTGEYNKHYSAGVYTCAGCNTPLYTSSTKFDSGCGWPAYFDSIPGAVRRIEDRSHGMLRTEIVCTACGGHLGHVFKGEGYKTPTDERHCIVATSSYTIGAILSTLNGIAIISGRDVLGYLYSNDAAVIALVSSVMPLAAFFQISDGLCAIGNGILRGCGKQHQGAYVNLFGYYVLGLPIGIFSAFTLHMGIIGMWSGMTIALVLNSIAIGYLVWRTDWQVETAKALLLVGRAPRNTCNESTDQSSDNSSDL